MGDSRLWFVALNTTRGDRHHFCTVAFFHDRAKALDFVKRNAALLSERDYYAYAVVEGVLPADADVPAAEFRKPREETWFRLDHGPNTATPCDRPEHLANIIHFSISGAW